MRIVPVFFAATALWAAADDTWLMRGVTIHPVSGPDVQNAMILVQDGKIAELGLKIVAPKGIRFIEGKGLHVYPGMIDSATEIGLSEISSIRETNDATELGDFNPQLRAVIAVNSASEHIPVTRANGITSVITMPEGGILSGQAALIHLDGWTWEEMAVKRDAAMHMIFPSLRASTRRSGAIAGATAQPFAESQRRYQQQLKSLRDFFEQARRYQKAKAQPGSGFKIDLKMEAMLPVLDGKMPVMISAVRERAIREAVDFATREKIRVILAGVRQPGKMGPELKAKNIPVILGATLELPLEQDDPYDKSFTLPAELHKDGVKIAFGTFGNQFARNLPFQAANAVAFGLPYPEALKAVTLNAAEIWGVADQVGSIEKGKLADLVIADGDPLESRTQIKQLYIKGKQVDIESKHYKLYQKYLNRP
jgi:imidazolonepropionase-like amidohydrolase